MTGEPVDLRGVLQSLHDRGVDFLLFGSTAMLFYGFVRATEDVDVVVKPEPRNLHRVHDWLISIDARLALNPARAFGPQERWAMLKGGNATVTSRLGRLDVVQRIEGMPDWPELVADSEVYERDGVEVRVMGRETLIALKRRRGSPQDLADIEAIRSLETLDD